MRKIASFLGTSISIIATILLIIGGLLSLIICFGIVKEVFGPVVSFLSLAVFPILLVMAPLYALLAWGNWFPIAFVYGLGITVTILFYIVKHLWNEDN